MNEVSECFVTGVYSQLFPAQSGCDQSRCNYHHHACYYHCTITIIFTITTTTTILLLLWLIMFIDMFTDCHYQNQSSLTTQIVSLDRGVLSSRAPSSARSIISTSADPSWAWWSTMGSSTCQFCHGENGREDVCTILHIEWCRMM